jgi:hypothetical protein
VADAELDEDEAAPDADVVEVAGVEVEVVVVVCLLPLPALYATIPAATMITMMTTIPMVRMRLLFEGVFALNSAH